MCFKWATTCVWYSGSLQIGLPLVKQQEEVEGDTTENDERVRVSMWNDDRCSFNLWSKMSEEEICKRVIATEWIRRQSVNQDEPLKFASLRFLKLRRYMIESKSDISLFPMDRQLRLTQLSSPSIFLILLLKIDRSRRFTKRSKPLQVHRKEEDEWKSREGAWPLIWFWSLV